MRLALALALCPAAFAAPAATIIKDARIVTVSGPEIARGSVVIRNGLIEAVGANVEEPADAWVIDGAGYTVYPGLIDALSRWGLSAIPGAAPRVHAADYLAPPAQPLHPAVKVGFTSAVTFPDRGIFGGHGAVINLAGDTPGSLVVHPEAGMIVALRTAGGTTYPNSLLGVIASIRQFYLDAGHYRAAQAYYAAHPKGNPRPSYNGALEDAAAAERVLLPASEPKDIARMLALAAELGLKPVLYGLTGAYRAAAELRDTPALVDLRWPEKSANANPEIPEPRRRAELREKAPSTPAALAASRVRFAFFARNLNRAEEVPAAVRRARAAGLSEGDALRALTLAPAEIFGVADRLGSIEPGKIANLVVAKGGLFDEQPGVRYVFIDGVRYEPK